MLAAEEIALHPLALYGNLRPVVYSYVLINLAVRADASRRQLGDNLAQLVGSFRVGFEQIFEPCSPRHDRVGLTSLERSFRGRRQFVP